MNSKKAFGAAAIAWIFCVEAAELNFTSVRSPPLPESMLSVLLEEPDSQTDSDSRNQFLTFVGREDLATYEEDSPRRGCKPFERAGKEVSPFDEILKRAAATRIVIVNEAHDAPQGRAFIAEVATVLKTAGYSFYAAEAFSHELNRPTSTWPKSEYGFYVNEPIFGALLRKIMALKFEMIPYEVKTASPPSDDVFASIEQREETQASNLIDQFFKSHPNGKILIHVGYSHAFENPVRTKDGRYLNWMAARLKEKTGIDPLTIDQTKYVTNSNSWILCGTDDEGQALPTTTDLHVAMPTIVFDHGRPAWRSIWGQRQVEMPLSLRRPDEISIVEARFSREPNDAVPVDRVLLRPGENLPLLLPKGIFHVEVWTRKNGWSKPIEMTIK